jgi:hypothetical protein
MNSFYRKMKGFLPMKKNILIVAVLLVVGSLVACSSLSFSSSSSSSRQKASASAVTDPTKLTVEAKTGIGILKLEGTGNAVDAAQAKELLPLFLALKNLSTNNNTAVAEISALNKQTQTTLTSDQLTAIQNMTFTSADIRTLMETNGLLDTAASGTSSKSSNTGGGFGGPPDGGIPGMGGPGGGTSSTSKTVATPNAAASASSARKTAGGLNLTFAEPIIKLLQSKISK